MPRVSLDTWRRIKPFKPKVTAPNMTAMKEFRAAESILPLSTAELESFVMLYTLMTTNFVAGLEERRIEGCLVEREPGHLNGNPRLFQPTFWVCRTCSGCRWQVVQPVRSDDFPSAGH